MSKLLTLFMFSMVALAETAPAKNGVAGLTPFIPMVLIFGVFYFLVIRPQQKKQKLQQKFLSELKRGDMVVTASGIIGTIKTLNERFVTLEIDDDVCIKVVRGQIAEDASNLKDKAESKVLETKTKPA